MESTAKTPPNLDLLLDVRVKLTVELGACQLPMRDVLQLAAGSVVKLDKAARAPVDIYVNQKRIARGEVVVVDDTYGIKITELFGAASDDQLRRPNIARRARRFGEFFGCGFSRRPPATRPRPSTLALPDAGASVFRVMGALILVIAVFLGGVWLFRNWQRLATKKSGGAKLNLLEVKSLGQRQSLYVVGYQQQRMLLASSPAGITLVSHLPAAEESEANRRARAEDEFSPKLSNTF